MIDAAIVGLGRWGKTLVEAVQGKSDKLRFTRAVSRDPAQHRDFLDHGPGGARRYGASRTQGACGGRVRSDEELGFLVCWS